ncbi:ComEC family competence protein [Cereibacter sphaeroides]|uniref:ComEC/Rec2 family competence protein n=1 Tax=Cereibacter sphaeroides TaxID=1063 RepID=UPI001F43CD0B|nr:ComEC/Rec2 family competence protein [Cereibacter sphaeroides]MCE6950164.1 ComEC family competence protein [Cereibacter sphaeroides]
MRALALPLVALAEARGFLFPWVPVFLGIGIGLWFAPAEEPGPALYLAALALLAGGIAGRLRGPELLHPPIIAATCIAAGFLAAGFRAQTVAAPILGFHYYGAVEGRVVAIDRSQSDAMRLTLDRVVLERTSPERTPERVRLTIHGEQPFTPEPGMVVMLTGHLDAPLAPAEPGGFDFRRMAFFDRLGAVGYTRTPVVLLEPADPGAAPVARLRAGIRTAVQDRFPGEAGAFAAAVLTGDYAGISAATMEDMRRSGLAHILAISGLNMSLIAGFVFAIVRYGLALSPPLALRLPTKKIAAGAAFLATGFYLLMSGGNVATLRAFVMIAFMLAAILADRRALSMRTFALAATIILLWQPEALLEAGFQMSFAATGALIWGFNGLRERVHPRTMSRLVAPIFMLFLSSLIGGLSTGPYAAAHFNRIAVYGLLGNLIAVPVMELLVMPAAALSALLAPLGAATPALWVMELGARWILWVAHWVAALPGSLGAVPSPGPWVLPLLTLGGLWLMLWRGQARHAGIAVMALSFWLWSQNERPPLLVASDGALVGLMGPQGRALSTPRGGGFAAETWLENDGDLADQPTAADRQGFDGPREARRFRLGALEGVALKGQGAAALVPEACATARLVILTSRHKGEVPEGCLLIDEAVLDHTGSLAVWPDADGPRLQPARAGNRLWSGAQ